MRVLSPDLWGALTIYGEARGESYLGQCAVGEVIRNRIIRRLASDGSVAGTVLKAKQFSCWMDGDPNRLAIAEVDDAEAAWQSCVRAWDESATSIATRGATHYMNPELVLRIAGRIPTWAADARDPTRVAEALVTLREGRHTFLKLL
jgi:spore germination cell wall hydrolase CwlJ-like protein